MTLRQVHMTAIGVDFSGAIKNQAPGSPKGTSTRRAPGESAPGPQGRPLRSDAHSRAGGGAGFPAGGDPARPYCGPEADQAITEVWPDSRPNVALQDKFVDQAGY